ncbi:MAG: urate hydroxylase PuuD [Gammaproteobacteria bacterium]|uniref:urate hydroxylase PuuD n=1 Tax=Hydrogenophaga sp. TaxID=1904254 RepID=UPI0025BCC21A|nr:urate hydroxylase PuuD [Hydrogenophaga sp.]MBU4183360.1 urate hydroxylase PuuD [Gammaproteobacteria bacterium]MBU4279193.1 urate hydroxylase PuuD [Gammaproteobacteria bacterium]MBU4325810.1 urate hydroxylase PuuD [Gammaproteobacteria bacterium]MBU4505855.1 urate hydroxylase PuuD [Gammaproteobacteria bacterium]MCG2657200.1 urate hydroxylase PuuD [Hydrogenophaga sp.]
METYLLDWANLLLRWLHVIVAIAWIGSSFYFVFLDSSLTPPEDEQLKIDGVSGELWALHGGGFYHPVKFAGAPPKLPEHLHWFYWESYSTWLSGFALFLISYLWSPSVYLIDPNIMQWSPAGAIAAALAFLVVFWLLYDAICRTLGQTDNGDAKVGALVLVLVCIAAYAATQMFAGRAAFLLMGAMLATSMSANVFFWIIPGQRTVVADIKAGRPVDPIHGKRGKQRSVHNTYFTLPVLFAMLSNHYSFTYANEHNWLILIGMMFAGAAIRQFFVMRHGFKLGRNPHPWPYAAVGVVALLALIVWLRPAPVAAVSVPETVGYAQLKPVIEQRCVMCHGEALQSKGVRLDQPAAVKQHAQMIYQQVVLMKAMPMNNATGLTDAERALFAQWFMDGAPTD